MATAKKITIHDVALAAGVSVSTVSLVLSGKGRISTATGERVNAAIEELARSELGLIKEGETFYRIIGAAQ